jgi:hypothetical protein
MSNQIRQELIRLFKSVNPEGFMFTAKVKAVNEQAFTCDIQQGDDEEFVLHNVRLKPALDGNNLGYIPIPEVGSIAVFGVLKMNEDDIFLVLPGKIKKCILNCDEVVFNGGLNEGLVNVIPLVREINKIHANMEVLKLATYALALVCDIAAAGTSTIFETATNAMQAAVTNDIEDNKVKH